jgi:hypothetical protein
MKNERRIPLIHPRWVGETLAEILDTLHRLILSGGVPKEEELWGIIDNALNNLTPEQERLVMVPLLISLASKSNWAKKELLSRAKPWGVKQIEPAELAQYAGSRGALLVKDEGGNFWVYDGSNEALRKLFHVLRNRE